MADLDDLIIDRQLVQTFKVSVNLNPKTVPFPLTIYSQT